MSTLYKVIVVGGGLAGLGAAYELSKDKRYQVTLLEQRDRIGGRIHALPIAGQMVDVGGFIVYPWYVEYHRILKELGLTNQLKKIPLQAIYYQIDQSGKYYTQRTIPFPKKDTARLALKLAVPVFQARDVAAPPLHSFDYMTGSEFFRDALNTKGPAGLYETYTNVVNQGYCYPSVDRFKMAFMAPFIRMSQFQGDVSDSFFVRSGNQQVPQALAAVITKAGNSIRTNVIVTGCTSTTAHTNQGDVSGDAIVFAQNVEPNVYQSILPDIKIKCGYTQYYSVIVELSGSVAVQGDTHWGAAFYLPDQTPLQIVSAVNLGMLYTPKLAHYLNLNIVVREAETHPQTADQLLPVLTTQLKKLFPDVTVRTLSQVVYWPMTMPIADEAFVGTVRARQGKLGHYFAGDWLGAPSMEAALMTGVRAAQQLIVDTTTTYQPIKSEPLYTRLNNGYTKLNKRLKNKITPVGGVRR
ncbi:MAG: FAD-dependent oxidoreductase [Candidatus Kerfeldbacteria bacterium]|nr:FAD-dependent oxidoreductase [Candidatus Kerfeldbacteria bacterium]